MGNDPKPGETPTTPVTPAPTEPTTPAPGETPVTPTADVPSFMQGIVDPTEGQVEARKVLTDPVPGDEPKPGETPENPDEPKPGETPAPENPDEPKPGETPAPVTPEPPKPGEPAKPEEPKPADPKKEEEDKTTTLGKALDQGIQNREVDAHIKNLVSKPLIKIEAPDPDSYKDEKGNFDLQSYMQDSLTRVVLELQKSLAGGALSAIQFGILKRGIQSESEDRIKAIKTDEAAKQTWDKLTIKFPILKTDETVGARFQRAIYGEKHMRSEKAKADGKEYIDLTYEDYEKIAADVVGGQPSPAPATPAPTETMTGSPQLGGGSTRGKDPVGDDIDDMMALKTKKGVIF